MIKKEQYVQELMPPEVMMPEGRLEELLEQALTQQLSRVEISSQPRLPVSLLTDFAYTRTRVPKHTTQVISLFHVPLPPQINCGCKIS